MSDQYFHFTLGPVQSFVSQARRTRDFWAGSFLLSWLSAVAIKAVKEQKGEICFPKEDEVYLDYLIGKRIKGQEPKQGNIPNRFKACIQLENFDPEVVTKAVQEAWKALADDIWQADIAPNKHLALEIPKKIWDRQIPNFWDMSWVITDELEDSSALDRRKNWRVYFPPQEAGVKCYMMDGRQELSGEVRPNRKEMNRFWEPLRSGMKSDLSEGEALCAIAFVKRRFSRHFVKLDHKMDQGWRLKGWAVPSGVPSVTYMAAVHWLEQVMEQCPADLLKQFVAEAKVLDISSDELQTNIKCLEKFNHSFKSLDGEVFYSNNLKNSSKFDTNKTTKILNILNEIHQQNIAPISPFYAILLMDGDSLGKNMSDIEKQPYISNGLKDFTQDIEAIVDYCSGFLIYAGGDDVLAILPLEDALPCATVIRQHYNDCFKDCPPDLNIKTSISGAIQYAHINTPLTGILKDSHELLDKIAKEQTGRDALAIRVWKRGGLQLEWAQPWDILLYEHDHQQQSYLETLVANFIAEDTDDQFSNRFFYKIREYFNLLNPSNDKDSDLIFDDPKQAIKLMTMVFINSGNTEISQIKNTEERMNKAHRIVKPLLEQCRPVIRDVDQTKKEWKRSHYLKADGALLIRFLANKGVSN